MYRNKYNCQTHIYFHFDQGFKRYEPKTPFSKSPHPPSPESYYKKSWVLGSRLVLCRCRVAQCGGNWLKLAKTVSQVYWFVSLFNAFCVVSLRSSVVVFWTPIQKSGVQSPLQPRFFYDLYDPWGSWVQTPLGFVSFFPPWNLISFAIYEFLPLFLTYIKQKNTWGISMHKIFLQTGVVSIQYIDFSQTFIVY